MLLCLGIAAIAKCGHINHCERPLTGAESGRPRASYEIRLDDLAALDPRRPGQTLGSQEFGVEETGLVPRSIVAKYGDDRVPRSHQPGQPTGAGHVDPGGRSEEHPSELKSLMRISSHVF